MDIKLEVKQPYTPGQPNTEGNLLIGVSIGQGKPVRIGTLIMRPAEYQQLCRILAGEERPNSFRCDKL